MTARTAMLTVALVSALAGLAHTAAGQQEPATVAARLAEQGDFGGAKTQPLAAVWEFSTDGGKTFGPMPAEVADATDLVARATFNVPDPAAVACLWAFHDDPKTAFISRGAFCTAGRDEAGGGECGATPLWTGATFSLNGKTPAGPLQGMMYHAAALQSDALLVKGTNTLTIAGRISALTGGGTIKLTPIALVAAAPQAPVIRSGPILGCFGEDYFTVTCRTGIPAEVTVTGSPVTPAGEKASATSPAGFYHRLKVPLPKGTRKFTYTVTAKVGDHQSVKGPIEVTLPAIDGKSLRVVSFGNSYGNYYSRLKAPKYVAGMLKCRPDVFVHLGRVVEFASWDFYWDTYYLDRYAPVLSTVPTYLVPDGGDHAGLALKLFNTPAGQSNVLNWTQVIGNVRLIGIDGAYDWSAGSQNAKWLESVLKESTEPFILVFNHFPGWSNGQQSRPRGGQMWRPLQQCRDVISPLLGKYRATAILSAFDFDYERVEPTPDKGVTSIIAGAGGAKTYRKSNRASANSPFSKDSIFREHTPSFVCFDIEGDQCVMKAYDLQGNVIDERTFAPRKP